MLTIHLNNVKFFAHHGLYEEEKLTGNEFEVNVIMHYHVAVPVVHHIHETINYVEVYDLVKARMQNPTPLLETVAMEIAQQILAQFPLADHVFISIAKLKPPIIDYKGSVAVSYELGRHG